MTPAQVSARATVALWCVRVGAAVGAGLAAWGYYGGWPWAVGLGVGLLAAWVAGACWSGWLIAGLLIKAAEAAGGRK